MESSTDSYGILYACPAGERAPDCPIGNVDNFSFGEKIQWFEKLSIEEKERIKQHHIECSNNRKREL